MVSANHERDGSQRPGPEALLLNPGRALPILRGFIADEVRKVSIAGVVVNLSGGIDSAVSTVLAAQALGPENVTALMLPYETSHPDSLADAEDLVDQLGIRSLTITISEQVDPYFAKFPDMSTLRRANKMARERMTILYDQ
ncbi:NAD(+) synthase, partial [Candidatus Poribacteria bacterium]|nr:NAD(+) synthase [Candidatus Poribacteria bacterium]